MRRLLAPSLLLVLVAACPGRAEPTPLPAPAERAGASRDAFEALGARVVGEGDGPVVILLHGHGARADDLVPLSPVLSVRPGMRFVFPAGPRDLGGGARAWWPLPPRHLREAALASGGRDLAREEPPGMIEARDAVVALLRESSSRFGVEPSEIVIGGFSQGAMMAVDAALHADEPPRGVISLSGALVAEAEWVPRMTRLARSSVFVSHGRRDTLLPFAGSENLAARLGEAAVPVTFVAFDGDHELPEEVITRLREHLGEILPAATSAP